MRTMLSVGLTVLVAGSLGTACARADARGRPGVPDVTSLLGVELPAVMLRSLDGSAVSLTDRVARGPSLIIVLGGKDCFSCSSHELELAILKTKLPGLVPIIVGSGPDEPVFRDYFKRAHLESVALLDRDRALLTSLRVGSEPLVLLVDTAGRILFVDARSSSAAAQFPFSRILPLLGGTLQPVVSSTSRSGEPN